MKPTHPLAACGVATLCSPTAAASSANSRRAPWLLNAQGANVILNLCYEKRNVAILLQAGGVAPMVASLQTTDQDLQANAAGAIQSIRYALPPRALPPPA